MLFRVYIPPPPRMAAKHSNIRVETGPSHVFGVRAVDVEGVHGAMYRYSVVFSEGRFANWVFVLCNGALAAPCADGVDAGSCALLVRAIRLGGELDERV